MDIKLLIILLDPQRVPYYLYSILFAYKNKLLTLKHKFRGMLSLPEGVTLYKLANSLPKKSTVVELGCYGGLSSAFILAGLNKSSFHYSIDPFDKDLSKQRQLIKKYKNKKYKKIELDLSMKKPRKKDVYELLKNEGHKNFKLITGYGDAVSKRWHKKIDFLWIDASHEYENVKRDFTDWSKFLKKGGIIAFHDSNKKDKSPYWKWGWPGPTKLVNEFIKSPSWIKIGRADSIVYATKNF